MISRSRTHKTARRDLNASLRFARIATIACSVVFSLGACADVPAAFGPSASTARSNADAMFRSFVYRFTNVYRAPRYAHARELLGRYALTPSEVFGDTTVWTTIAPDGTRTLFGDASFTNGHYVFSNVVSAEPLNSPGAARHIIRLRKLSDNTYEWFTGVDFAAGRITANDFASVVTRWLASAEGRNATTLRSDYRAAFPRTTAALGKLYTLDSLASTRDADGGNTVYAGIRITPDGVRGSLPAFAAYMDKYATKAKLHFTLADSRGARWLDVTSRDGYITLRVRSRDGHFVPLEGPLRSIPDTLVMKADMTAKIKLFTIGVQGMTGEWVNLHSEHERGWALRFTREPRWVLPPAAGYLLRSSLRRPFEGVGTQFRFVVRDDPGHQTLMTRRGSTTVQESAIIRFLGKLGGDAMGDFVATAEDQENRFNAGVFTALRADVDAALAR